MVVVVEAQRLMSVGEHNQTNEEMYVHVYAHYMICIHIQL